MNEGHEDIITVYDEEGLEKEFSVAGMFDMHEQSYALLKDENEVFVMRVEEEGDDQYLVKITDPDERASILEAYEIATEAEFGEES
ncbi:DUF1292 domain-containing protein [Alkalibacillus haloalkaliphilus]|uniref:DUF1292 domain-containing protein n=1 Tax=Alkalibacillus haloalkaliphilus TaxID=94136 RepID=A0A511W4W8_9BACI|nr:DUF1292 domain-containing protein [Alkalibacillus haloalkaliphilus]GEN45063.1 hypothetical protein AHA02nite_08390 [Alkalibacillus haloalkaliphilus]